MATAAVQRMVAMTQEQHAASRSSSPSSRVPKALLADAKAKPLYKFEMDGTGDFVVASCNIQTGQVVFEEVGTLQSHPDKYSIQVDEDRHVLCSGDLIFINHSCDSNCCLKIEHNGMVRAVAVRAIQEGERLCFDYLTTEWDMADPFQCLCGAANCRGRIAGMCHLADRSALDPAMLSSYIKKKIALE